MKKLITAALLPLLLLLPASCGTFSNLSDGIAKGREIVEDIKDAYEDLRPIAQELIDSGKLVGQDVQDAMQLYAEIMDELKTLKMDLRELDKEAFDKADKDGDGELDWVERLAYLLLLGGGGLAIGRRKLKSLLEEKKAAAASSEKE